MTEDLADKGKGPDRPLVRSQVQHASEGWIAVDAAGVSIAGGVLLPVKFDQAQLIMCGDAIAQVVEQFDDGVGLFGCPIGRDFEGDGERQTCLRFWS